MFFLLSPLAVKRDIAVTILLRCMCVRVACMHACVWPSGFVWTITLTHLCMDFKIFTLPLPLLVPPKKKLSEYDFLSIYRKILPPPPPPPKKKKKKKIGSVSKKFTYHYPLSRPTRPEHTHLPPPPIPLILSDFDYLPT